MEIEIVDKDEDGIGEILVKGKNITKGYFDDDIKTKETIVDGWMHTGDLGKIDDEGFIYLCGRNNEVIVLSNGKKIFPKELETKLNKIYGIKESLVFEKDNKINAKVVYSPNIFKEMTDDEIYNTIIGKIQELNEKLPQFKKVNDIIVTSQELEKTPIGKIKRTIELEKTKEKKIENTVNTNTDDTFIRVEKILIDKLGSKMINEESNLVLDLGADSLDIVEIVLAVEKNFNIKIQRDERKTIVKVKDILKILSCTSDFIY